MKYLDDARFTFTSQALEENAFGVISFEGEEGLSRCYRFQVDLVSSQEDIDLEAVLQNPAVFTIHRDDGDIPFHGVVEVIEQRRRIKEFYLYRAVLVPKLHKLALNRHNQVILDSTLPEILAAVMEDGGLLSGVDFELRLRSDSPEREYVCQYGESHLDFISRWMERDGVYYYFEQTPQGEKVVLTDTSMAHTPMPEGQTLRYSPPSGLEGLHWEEIVRSFTCKATPLPRDVEIKDYHYETPSLDLTARADVKPDSGRGTVYIYGLNYSTMDEGLSLARIRAEELLCREKVFSGESTIPFVRPGYVFDLNNHFRSDFNRTYLTIAARHSGNQAGYLTAGLKQALAEAEQEPHYSNSFQAIPAGVQFRAEMKTEKPRLRGTLNARIDAAASGKYAELDDQGRYKVILPFDLSGRSGGKASTYLRMMQPYAGSDHGMHFPLHKGTEVILTFIDGDPDRPVIAGAAPNSDTPSPVTSDNETKNAITTAGGNIIHIEDAEGKQRILVATPTANTWMRCGAPNDPKKTPSNDTEEKTAWDKISDWFSEGWKSFKEWWEDHESEEVAGWDIFSSDALTISVGLKNEIILGECIGIVIGLNASIVGIFDNKSVLGLMSDTTWGPRTTLHWGGEIEWASDQIFARPVRVQSIAAQVAAYGAQNRISTNDTTIRAASEAIIDNNTRAMSEHVSLTATKQSLVDSAIQAEGDTVRATVQRRQAVNTQMNNVGTALKTVGQRVHAAGTKLKHSSVRVGEQAETVHQAGTAIKNAGLAVHNDGFREEI